MHTHLPHNPDMTSSVIFGLGWVYLLLFVMNALWVRRSYAVDGNVRLTLGGLLGKGQDIPVASFWALYAAMLLYPTLPAFDAMLTMAPPVPAEIICFAAS